MTLIVAVGTQVCLADEKISFTHQIRPILSKNCFACHGPDETHRESGFALHREESARSGGESGRRGIVSGSPSESELFRRIQSTDDDERMPPADHAESLKTVEIELIRRWIEQGGEFDVHWSYRPIINPELPKVTNQSWPKNGIDYFILQRLEAAALEPAAEAAPERIVRRLYLDLIGLPPPPEKVAEFSANPTAENYERMVDALLANPAYGEHWARMWLDLARYADSQGYAEDNIRQIWLYRDWVIRAFNRDLPFDQFTIEQLAGDLLPNPTEDQLIATAFHRNTMTNSEGGTDDEEFRHAAIVDRTATTATVWMGTTFGCAQCHSHKFDPISHQDYYRMFAIFNQSEDSDMDNNYPFYEQFTPQQTAERERLQFAINEISKQIEIANEADKAGLVVRRDQLANQRNQVSPITVPIMRDLPTEGRRQTHIAVGGAFYNKGEVVEAALWPEFAKAANQRVDRLVMANWLMSEENPLTARVAVNRHWEKIFGRGIVETSEDFGSQGSVPSHPELLDWLATEFRAGGWSMKQLCKLIVMSATYRQDSRVTKEILARDPDNRLLSRGARYRLTAEQIRDISLATSGLLSPKMYGPPVRPPQPKSGLSAAFGGSLDWDPSPGEDRYRRGLYTLVRRTNLYPSFMAFDGTNRTTCTVRRINTNTPVAAFVTLNDPAFVECARSLALRLQKESVGNNQSDRLALAFRLVLARNPSEPERTELEDLLTKQRNHYRERLDEAKALAFGDSADLQTNGEGNPIADSEIIELASWTVIANVLLNLDETLTRN
ncbi:MAG: PSD1 and planctomycete cytochrome C domain-containing protein [Pirellulaceae bacterium]